MSLRKLASNIAAGVAYPGHRHFTQRLLNRRTFLEKSGITLGALAASGILPELARAAKLTTHGHNSTTAASPLPIPGGLQLLGPTGPLFHVFLPAPWCRALHDHRFQRLRGLGCGRRDGHSHRQRPGTPTPSLRGRCAFHARRVRWS